MGGKGFFFGQDIDLGGVQCGSLLGRLTGEGEGEQVLSLRGERLTGEGLLVQDLTGVHDLCLLGGEWQLIGLQVTGLL